MRRLPTLIVLAILLLTTASLAQTLPPEAARQDTETLHCWLESGDARRIAWAAFHTGKDVEPPELPGLKNHLLHLVEIYEPRSTWGTPVDYRKLTQREKDGSRAMLMVLNTLKQLNAGLPPDTALRLYPEFHTAPLVLLWNFCKPDASACDEAFLRILQSTAPMGDRVAVADMMAEKPPAGYVAALLRRTYLDVSVTVSVDGKQAGLGGGSSAGDCWGSIHDPEWPPESELYSTWQPSKKHAEPWVPSPVPIFLERASCAPNVPGYLSTRSYEVSDPEADVMWRLTLAALGQQQTDLPVKRRTAVGVRWTDSQHFRADIDAAYLQVRRESEELLKMLTQKGLLQPSEGAALLRAGEPETLQIRFTLFDQRPEVEQSQPIPAMRFHDPHVLWVAPPVRPSVTSAY